MIFSTQELLVATRRKSRAKIRGRSTVTIDPHYSIEETHIPF